MSQEQRISELEMMLEQRESNRIVLSLLNSSPYNVACILEELADIGFTPCGEYYIILHLSLLPGITAEHMKEIDSAHCQAKKHLEQLSGTHVRILYTHDIDSLYCIVNTDVTDMDAKLEACARAMLEGLERENYLPFCIGISTTVHNISQICYAYRGLRELWEYRHFTIDDTPILYYDRIAYRFHDSGAQNSAEKHLIYAIRTNHYGEAMAYLDQLFTILFEKEQPGAAFIRGQFYRLVNPLTDTLTEMMVDVPQGSDEWMHLNDALAALFRVSTLTELQSRAEQAIRVLETVHTRKISQTLPKWMHELDALICREYQNPQLSVSMLADQIGISSVHMSRVFRQLQGCGVMDYVHHLRVQTARALLEQGDSVKNVSVRMGYASPLSMTRAFKKYDGKTPGFYIPVHNTHKKQEA